MPRFAVEISRRTLTRNDHTLAGFLDLAGHPSNFTITNLDRTDTTIHFAQIPDRDAYRIEGWAPDNIVQAFLHLAHQGEP